MLGWTSFPSIKLRGGLDSADDSPGELGPLPAHLRRGHCAGRRAGVPASPRRPVPASPHCRVQCARSSATSRLRCRLRTPPPGSGSKQRRAAPAAAPAVLPRRSGGTTLGAAPTLCMRGGWWAGGRPSSPTAYAPRLPMPLQCADVPSTEDIIAGLLDSEPKPVAAMSAGERREALLAHLCHMLVRSGPRCPTWLAQRAPAGAAAAAARPLEAAGRRRRVCPPLAALPPTPAGLRRRGHDARDVCAGCSGGPHLGRPQRRPGGAGLLGLAPAAAAAPPPP